MCHNKISFVCVLLHAAAIIVAGFVVVVLSLFP